MLRLGQATTKMFDVLPSLQFFKVIYNYHENKLGNGDTILYTAELNFKSIEVLRESFQALLLFE